MGAGRCSPVCEIDARRCSASGDILKFEVDTVRVVFYSSRCGAGGANSSKCSASGDMLKQMQCWWCYTQVDAVLVVLYSSRCNVSGAILK